MILLFIFVFIAGVAKACMDTLQFHYGNSIFFCSPSNKLDNYFDASVSWRNKYKNGNPEDGPKFIGSTTIFVFLTDGWHLFQAIFLAFIFLSIVFYVPILNYPSIPLLGKLFDYFILSAVFGVAFNLFYDKILK